MKRRAFDAMDVIARLFDAAHADQSDEDYGEDGDSTALVPKAPSPPGDPRLGMRMLARLVADEARRGEAPEALAARSAAAAGGGAPRRRRKEPIRAVAARDQVKARTA